MFFPIGDDDSQVTITPLVTYTMIGLNVLVFLYQLSLGTNIEQFFMAWATIPAEITSGQDLPPGIPAPVYVTLLTSMFMHGGFMHIFGNMAYLWVFGNNIEAALGHARYVIFYLACGLLASLAHVFFNANSVIPSLGASGAISGVLGAYIVMFPRGRVRVLMFNSITHVPAFVALGMWILLQLVSGVGSLGADTAQTGGVAYMAHIGGFIAGMALGPILRQRAILRT
ncbi:MAG: rhomboid family intramembrane serine protease [Acidobacteriota bacterium]